MSRYSPLARRNLLATSAEADIVVALEIHHEDLEVPVRVVNDSQNLEVVINGDDGPETIEFIACPFDISLPDDVDQQMPRATLTVDNIGRELTQWLEYSRGGKGAKVRILQATRSDVGSIESPINNPWEFDMLLDMSGIKVDNLTVSAVLGFQEGFNQPAVKVRYDPKTAPGLW